MTTIAEIHKSALPPGTKLLAGEAGLFREVSWAATLRPTPPAFESIKGGELALVSVNSARLLDQRMTVPRLIKSLGETGVAAVAVLGQVPDEAREVAETMAMPLFALPAGSSLHRIEQAVIKAIIELRSQLYQQEQAISRELIELAIHGKGIPAIARKVFEITSKATAVGDEAFEIQFYAAPPDYPVHQEEVVRLLRESRPSVLGWLAGIVLSASDPPAAKFKLSTPGLVSIVAPIIVADHASRFLCILGRENEMEELERVAVVRGAAACAIEAARDKAVIETQDRMQADFLDDLLSGNFATLEAIIARGRRFGFVPTSSYAVLALRVERTVGASISLAKDERELSNLQKRAAELIQSELRSRGVSALCEPRNGHIILLYPAETGNEPSSLKISADRLTQMIRSYLKETVISVGMGRFYPTIEKLSVACQEAEKALAMGSQLFGKGEITYFGDLHVYSLLFRVHSTAELETFYQENLGKLAEYDRQKNSELIKTLEAYFNCGDSPTEAAKSLHLHRNTLLYRLSRIRDITGLDLDDPETRLSLHLALKVGETLRATTTKDL